MIGEEFDCVEQEAPAGGDFVEKTMKSPMLQMANEKLPVEVRVYFFPGKFAQQ